MIKRKAVLDRSGSKEMSGESPGKRGIGGFAMRWDAAEGRISSSPTRL